MINNRYSNILVFSYLTIFAILIFFGALANPLHNWDMLGYAASALSFTEQSASNIHHLVYQQLLVYVPDSEFERLTQSDHYRSVMFNDVEAFRQQIPYYKIRIIFVGCIAVLHAMGFDIFHAGHIVSAFFASSALLIYYFAFRTRISPFLFLLLPPIFILLDGYIVAKSVFADSLGFFYVGLLFWSYLKNSRWLYLLLPLSVLIRTDLIILVFLFIGVIAWVDRSQIKWLVSAFIASVLLYLSINNWVGNYGWGTVYHFVFQSDMQLTLPANFEGFSFDIAEYVGFLLQNFTFEVPLGIYIVSCVLFLYVCTQYVIIEYEQPQKTFNLHAYVNTLLENQNVQLVFISSAYITAHYLLFPVLWSRFFIPYYFLSVCILLVELSQFNNRFSQFSQRK